MASLGYIARTCLKENKSKVCEMSQWVRVLASCQAR